VRRVYKRVMHSVVGLLLVSQVVAADSVQIREAWIPAAPPVVRVMAAYLVVENITSKPVSIRSITSPLFGVIEIHKTEVRDGMASMHKLEKLSVPAHSQLEFKPGAMHLMLMDRKQNLAIGDKVPLQFVLENGEQFSTVAVVKTADTRIMDHSQHH